MGAVKSAASHTYSCAPAPVQYAAAQVGPAITLALFPLVTLSLLQPVNISGLKSTHANTHACKPRPITSLLSHKHTPANRLFCRPIKAAFYTVHFDETPFTC